MNALREILEVHNNRVVIDLPPHFGRGTVEVIILPVEQKENRIEQEPVNGDKNVDYDQYFGITNIGQETIDRHLQAIRDEWERTCT